MSTSIWNSLGYFYTAGPIVANGVLVTGITGCERYKDDVCFYTGHDPLTGEELWRFSTVAIDHIRSCIHRLH